MKRITYIVLYVLLFTTFSCIKKAEKQEIYAYTKLEGVAFGTSFHITYDDSQDYTKQVDSLFHLINKSLSTYIPNSDISKINSGDTTIVVDNYFKEVFEKSEKIYEETNGVFDPTIGVLVNAWDFGPKQTNTNPDTSTIKRLLDFVGFDKVRLQNRTIIKENDSIYFDFNAIAKGYAVDIAGRFLESKSVKNYLVEIGGEIRTRGISATKQPWKTGIEEPNFDGTRSIGKVIGLTNQSMATSGSYRKFKIDTITGKKYVHIINPRTGYPTQSNLLSVSVISELDCADVDGYATALMAMTLKEAKQFLAEHTYLRGYLIYVKEDDSLETFTTENF